MPNGFTPNFGLRLLIPGDTDNVLNLNQNLELLDVFTNLVLESITNTTEPPIPTVGKAWYIPIGAVGSNWSGNIGKIAYYVETVNGAPGWRFLTLSRVGTRAYVVDANNGIGGRYVWDGAAWNTSGTNKPFAALHGGVPAAGASKYPLLFASSPIVFAAINLTNHGGAGTVLPEIRFGSNMGSSGTVLVTPDTNGTTGWANTANVKTTGSVAWDPDRLPIPLGSWVWYEIPSLTSGGCNVLSVSGIYQEG